MYKNDLSVYEQKQVIGLKYFAEGEISDDEYALLVKDGASGFSTFMSYFIVFWVRIVHTHRIIPIHWHPIRFSLNFVLLMLQCWVLLTFVDGWILSEVILCGLVIAVNLRQLLAFLLPHRHPTA